MALARVVTFEGVDKTRMEEMKAETESRLTDWRRSEARQDSNCLGLRSWRGADGLTLPTTVLRRPAGQPPAARARAMKDPGNLGGSEAGLCPGGRRSSCDGQTEEVPR
jgi:hypothetical protein